MRLEQRLDRIGETCRDKIALSIVGGATLSFSTLCDTSKDAASKLVENGVRPGDRVAIVSRHDLDALVSFWAVLRAGAIVVWLNDDAKSADFPDVVSNADPTLILIQNEKHRRLFAELPEYSSKVILFGDLRKKTASIDVALPTGLGDDQPALIIYTSGSSGRPKGVCLSHRNLMTVAMSVIEHMPISEVDSYLMVVPLHYVHGIMQLLVHTFAGATIYFQDNFLFPRKVVDTIRTTRVSGFSGVPFHFSALITRGALLETELPDLKWMTVTGGKLPASTIVQILDSFRNIRFHIAYGQTECAPRATALHPSRIRDKLDSVGSAIPGVQVLLLGDDGKPVPEGDSGEVVIAGDNVMMGYWRDEAATKLVVDKQGRLHTGDIGRFDKDGDLFLIGRQSAMIKSAGERIVPEEIERVLVAHDAVQDAVVVGVDDPMLGQRVVAHVEIGEADGTDIEQLIAEIRQHCLERIPMIRAPREYKTWRAFPHKANGKPDRIRISRAPSDD